MAAFLVAAALAAAPAPVLWRDVRAGMTLEQVQARLPQGRLSNVYRDPCWLVPNLPVGRHRYDACVFLRDGRARSVLLKNRISEGYEEVKGLLARRYGRPKEECGDNGCTAMWTEEGVRITASRYHRASVRTVTVRFEPVG